ncbi:hypothetical protein EMIT0P258_60294 [Pseudomonas sp. IT-P258]
MVLLFVSGVILSLDVRIAEHMQILRSALRNGLQFCLRFQRVKSSVTIKETAASVDAPSRDLFLQEFTCRYLLAFPMPPASPSVANRPLPFVP